MAAACALIAVAAATGIAIDLFLGSPLRVLSYFTIQSNLIVTAVLPAMSGRAWSGRPPLPTWFTGGTTLFISITDLVYHLVLADADGRFSMTNGTGVEASGPWRTIANDLLHTVAPIGTALIWLLLVHPGGLRLRHAACGCCTPSPT